MQTEGLDGLTTTNVITIISVIIVITGWFINGVLRRRQDILKEKLKYRLEALNYCVDFIFYIEQNISPFDDVEFDGKMSRAKQYLFFFGTNEEYTTFLCVEKQLYESRASLLNQLEKLKKLIKADIGKTLKLS